MSLNDKKASKAEILVNDLNFLKHFSYLIDQTNYMRMLNIP